MLNPSEITLSEVCSPAQFEQENPDLFIGPEAPSMEYLVRLRRLTGWKTLAQLLKCRPGGF